jgi:hypothetical protein
MLIPKVVLKTLGAADVPFRDCGLENRPEGDLDR